jgi:hypothetical protein
MYFHLSDAIRLPQFIIVFFVKLSLESKGFEASGFSERKIEFRKSFIYLVF